MRVTNSNINFVFSELKRYKELAFDTETTGLRLFKDHSMFAFVIAHSVDEAYYFDFEFVNKAEALRKLSELTENPLTLWFLHNAKFDMHAIQKEGIKIKGTIHDTEIVARLIKNDEMTYTLGSCAKRAKLKNQKMAEIKDYCIEHGFWEWELRPGRKSRNRNYFFDKVPKEIMEEYTLLDGLTTFELGKYQQKQIAEMDKNKRVKVAPLRPLMEMEFKITKILQEMETTGVQLNLDYVRRSLDLENSKFAEAANNFQVLTGKEFKDSDKLFVDVFRTYGLTYGLTDKGNPSFTKDFLKPQASHPVVASILQYRDSFKVAGAYYQSFLSFADGGGVLHANIKQGGATTGRFSVTDPPLQTLKKEEDDSEETLSDETKSQVRRCLVPRPGFRFVMIDYKQMEYRVMLDYAGETALIEKVAAGMCVHQATADVMGGTRKAAKQINFLLLYGGGDALLAHKLGVSLAEARRLKSQYFEKLPAVKKLIDSIISTARNEGRLYNKFGRVYSFLNRNFAYKAPNYLIQGGCSDAMRTAMVKCHEILEEHHSRMIMQIHDELLFEIHENELDLVPLLKQAMIEAYPHRLLPMDCDVEFSTKSWQEKEAWV